MYISNYFAKMLILFVVVNVDNISVPWLAGISYSYSYSYSYSISYS